MATIDFEAGKLWRNAILVRLAQLELKVTEIPLSRTKSTYVISYHTAEEARRVNLFLEQVEDTLQERAAEKAARRRKQKAKEDAEKLASINFFRKVTFRKPLDKLPA